MMLSWKRLGRVYVPDGSVPWMVSHATVPTPMQLEGSLYRIYFSARNELNQNRVGWVEIDLKNPTQILKVSDKPVLDIGSLGEFDSDGVYVHSLVQEEKSIRMYFAGWNAGIRGTFYSSIGVAESFDGGKTFVKYQANPILARGPFDKWAVMAPFVIKRNPKSYIMYYTSGISLSRNSDETLSSQYDIKLATSVDGVNWSSTGIVAVGLGDNDSNIARCCVFRSGNSWKAFYPYVSKELKRYRIGYGESKDGVTFTRLDEKVDFQPSADPAAWDSEAITYPHVLEHDGKTYILYNGNGFGSTGFGIAELIGG